MSTTHDETLVDVKLFKTIGLYQLLYPYWNGSLINWYRKALMAIIGLIFSMHMVPVVGLYFIMRNLELFMNGTVMVMCGLLSLFKTYVIVSDADQLWSVLDIARYTFTSCSRRNTCEIRRCRVRVSTLLRIFTVVSYGTLVTWIATPWFMEVYVPIVNMDGTTSNYRNTVYYQWYPVSESVYNSNYVWALIYTIEVISLSINVVGWLWFDCYTLTVCLTLETHFNTLLAAYEELSSRITPLTQYLSDVIPIESNDNKKLNYCNEIIILLKDNQKLIRKLDHFYDIITPVILVQIFNGSYTVITMIYLTILTYTTNRSIVSVLFFKYSCGFISTAMELYMFCYAFQKIEVAKSAVNFGLYSSNWTEMDLRFKKILLLTINMNSIHKKAMKISPISLVNLEMFARIMKMSYTIVSVLLNRSGQE